VTKKNILSNGKRWAPTWMPFYVDDYMLDEKVIDLTPVGRSVYVELLCSSWSMGGSLPNRPEHLWKYTLLTSKEEWDSVAAEVLALFKVVDGRLVNPRLVEEFQNQRDFVNSRIKGGKTASDKRWGNSSADSSATSLAGISANSSGVQKERKGEERKGKEKPKTMQSHTEADSLTNVSVPALPSEPARRVAEKLAEILGRTNLKPATVAAWASQVESIVTAHGEKVTLDVMQSTLVTNSDGFWRGRIYGMKNFVRCFNSMHEQAKRKTAGPRAAVTVNPLAARAASLNEQHDFTSIAKGDL
jgi:uncharacterized protein YdaU (DUF1376 family)